MAEDLCYEEKSLGILACKVKTLRTKNIAFVKVWWRNQPMEEATWERDNEIREKYPEFSCYRDFRGRKSFLGGLDFSLFLRFYFLFKK